MIRLSIEQENKTYLAHDNLHSVEWPPGGNRVFSGLANTFFAQQLEQVSPMARTTLERLASFLPDIYVPSQTRNDEQRFFCPVINTGTLLTKRDWQEESWGDKPDKVKREGTRRAKREVIHRSVNLTHKNVIHFLYHYNPSDEEFMILQYLARNMAYFGKRDSLCTATFHRGNFLLPDDYVAYVPSSKRTPCQINSSYEGRLKDLEVMFANNAIDQGVKAFYQKHEAHPLEREVEHIVLRIHNSNIHVDHANAVINLLTKSIHSKLPTISAEVTGHAEIDRRIRFACSALPDIGHTFSTGIIHGFIISIPKEITAESVKFHKQALAEVSQLTFRDVVYPLSYEANLKTLQINKWTRPSRLWTSITPVACNHTKKKTDQKQSVIEEVQKSLQYNYGITADSIDVSFMPRIRNSANTLYFNQRPHATGRSPYLTHITVRFSNKVQGLLRLGSYRNFGYGLMYPLD